MLRVRNFFRAIKQRFNRAKLLNQIARALFTNSRRAGNIVRAVAPKREEVRNLFRSNPEELAHLFAIDDQVVLRRVQDQDGIDQLVQILIESNDHGIQSGGEGLRRNACDDVVGFVSGNLEN